MTEPTAHKPQKTRRRGMIAGAVVGLALAGGGLSIAASAQSAPSTKASADQQHEAGEQPEATYKSSITSPEMPEKEEATDAEEAAQDQAEATALAKLATVTPAQAADAATKAVPGRAATPELENEDGNVVYDVTVTSTDGKTQTDVIVDAGNAKVLAQEVENDHEDHDASEGHEATEKTEKADTGSNDAPAPAPSSTPGAATGN